MTLLQGTNSYESSFNSTAQEDLPGLVLSFSNATTPGTARKSIKIIHSCEKRPNVCTSALSRRFLLSTTQAAFVALFAAAPIQDA
jgi:hypothetical protein